MRRLSGITDPAFYGRRKVGFPAAFRQLHWELQRRFAATEPSDVVGEHFRSPFERAWNALSLRSMREGLGPAPE